LLFSRVGNLTDNTHTQKKKPARWKGRDGTVGTIDTLVSQHYERKFDRSVVNSSYVFISS
jgi:hypothetical protein